MLRLKVSAQAGTFGATLRKSGGRLTRRKPHLRDTPRLLRVASGKHIARGVLAALACGATGSVAQPVVLQQEEMRVATELLQLPEDKIDIGEVGLRLSGLYLPDTDLKAGNAQIDSIVRATAEMVAGRAEPSIRIRALNTVLYSMLGFAYDKTDFVGAKPENARLWRYLKTKRGNCLTMPLLWYAVAQRLGYPVAAVNAPQHFFLRYALEKGDAINIEATSGSVPTDEMIIRDLQIPAEAVKSGAFMRTLSRREYVAELVANLGAHEFEMMNFALARDLLLLAGTVAPNSLAVHWNLAMVYAGVAQMTSVRRTVKNMLTPKKQLPTAPDRLPVYADALKEAREATRLGAVPPLPDDYWLHEANPEAKEGAISTGSQPKPFDVVPLVRAQAPVKTSNCTAPEAFSAAVAWSKAIRKGAAVNRCAGALANLGLRPCLEVAMDQECRLRSALHQNVRADSPELSRDYLEFTSRETCADCLSRHPTAPQCEMVEKISECDGLRSP